MHSYFYRPWLMPISFHHWLTFLNMVIIKLVKKQPGLWLMQHQVEHRIKSSIDVNMVLILWISTIFHWFRYVIDQGAIPPLCELLSVTDTKIIQVAFNGLENILKLGAMEAKRTNGPNPYAIMIEECFGKCPSLIFNDIDDYFFLFRSRQNRILTESRKYWSLSESLSHHWDLFRCWRRRESYSTGWISSIRIRFIIND